MELIGINILHKTLFSINEKQMLQGTNIALQTVCSPLYKMGLKSFLFSMCICSGYFLAIIIELSLNVRPNIAHALSI